MLDESIDECTCTHIRIASCLHVFMYVCIYSTSGLRPSFPSGPPLQSPPSLLELRCFENSRLVQSNSPQYPEAEGGRRSGRLSSESAQPDDRADQSGTRGEVGEPLLFFLLFFSCWLLFFRTLIDRSIDQYPELCQVLSSHTIFPFQNTDTHTHRGSFIF